MQLTSRHRNALTAFETREVVKPFHLPNSIGRKTMEELVEAGLVELVDPTVGAYSSRRAWRLRKAASE